MALLITDKCLNCDVCEPVCPNKAIGPGASFFAIESDRFTECVGHFAKPRCRVVCPVACLAQDPNRRESREQLLAKFRRLRAPADAKMQGGP